MKADALPTLQIPTARAFLPLLSPKRFKGAFGGRGGAKSWFFAGRLIEDMLCDHIRSACVREIQNSIQDSVKQTLEDMIQRYDVGPCFKVTEREIVGPHDSLIIFKGLQNHTAASIKSLEGFNRCWVEEAQTITQRSLDILIPTFRKERTELSFSWNRVNATDPIDVFFRENEGDEDFVCIKVNYTDNPWLPDDLRRDMLRARKKANKDIYRHVWLGDYRTQSEARVFDNWKVEAFETPSDAIFYFGADWGFSVDPTVLVRCFIKGSTLFFDREAYKVGCQIDETPALFAGTDPRPDAKWKNPLGHPGIPGAMKWAIRADSARPETIAYMNARGFNVVPAIKGTGSVEEGVEFLKNYDIVIHPRCKHVADEFAFYSYKIDPKTNKILPVLEDKKNHVIDSARYALEEVRRAKPLQLFF
jgi:phage terminase large subunit